MLGNKKKTDSRRAETEAYETQPEGSIDASQLPSPATSGVLKGESEEREKGNGLMSEKKK